VQVVGIMLVRDGADILEACLDHHLAQGVDHILVTDNRSVDATSEILHAYAETGRVTVRHEPRDDFDQGPWLSALARDAAMGHGADWVVPIDVDEFWWTDEGTVRDRLAAVEPETEVLVLSRFDFLYRPAPPEPFERRLRWRYADSVNFLGMALGPKVCFRAHPAAAIDEGNHRVLHPVGGRVVADDRISILHFPMRSQAQFTAKVVNGGRARERNPRFGPDISIVWRHGLELQRQGRFDEAWATWVLDDDELEQLIASGKVVEDTRLADRLAARRALV
jgi:hypothetical protein